MREIILDTETTGLDPKQGHRVIEIGAVELYNKVPTGSFFHYYLNPMRDVPMEAFRIHGLSTEFLKDKPLFQEIADEFLSFIEGAKIVIHNAKFDTNFLNHELSLIRKASIDQKNVIDTLEIARKKFPTQRNNLDALCKRFKIDNTHRKYHGALLDAELLADVYVELMGGRQASFKLVEKQSENEVLIVKNQETQLELKLVFPNKQELALHEEFVSNIPNSSWKKLNLEEN